MRISKSHLAFIALTVCSTLQASADTLAAGRAAHYGRANGVAIACKAPEQDRQRFVMLVSKRLPLLAQDANDLNRAKSIMTLETETGKSAMANGILTCDAGLEFFRSQLQKLERSPR